MTPVTIGQIVRVDNTHQVTIPSTSESRHVQRTSRCLLSANCGHARNDPAQKGCP